CLSASLREVATYRSALDQATAARDRSAARLSGGAPVIGLLESLVRPLLRMLDPEDAHRLAIHALKVPPFVKLVADEPRLAVRAFGLDFPNPIGMAAGFGKHGEVAAAALQAGFCFL